MTTTLGPFKDADRSQPEDPNRFPRLGIGRPMYDALVTALTTEIADADLDFSPGRDLLAEERQNLRVIVEDVLGRFLDVLPPKIPLKLSVAARRELTTLLGAALEWPNGDEVTNEPTPHAYARAGELLAAHFEVTVA